MHRKISTDVALRRWQPGISLLATEYEANSGRLAEQMTNSLGHRPDAALYDSDDSTLILVEVENSRRKIADPSTIGLQGLLSELIWGQVNQQPLNGRIAGRSWKNLEIEFWCVGDKIARHIGRLVWSTAELNRQELLRSDMSLHARTRIRSSLIQAVSSCIRVLQINPDKRYGNTCIDSHFELEILDLIDGRLGR